MSKLNREDMMRAVTDGVREAFLEALTDDGRLALVSAADIFQAIKAGTQDAIWRIATNATDMPSTDFFASIEAGTAKAMREMRE